MSYGERSGYAYQIFGTSEQVQRRFAVDPNVGSDYDTLIKDNEELAAGWNTRANRIVSADGSNVMKMLDSGDIPIAHLMVTAGFAEINMIEYIAGNRGTVSAEKKRKAFPRKGTVGYQGPAYGALEEGADNRKQSWLQSVRNVLEIALPSGKTVGEVAEQYNKVVRWRVPESEKAVPHVSTKDLVGNLGSSPKESDKLGVFLRDMLEWLLMCDLIANCGYDPETTLFIVDGGLTYFPNEVNRGNNTDQFSPENRLAWCKHHNTRLIGVEKSGVKANAAKHLIARGKLAKGESKFFYRWVRGVDEDGKNVTSDLEDSKNWGIPLLVNENNQHFVIIGVGSPEEYFDKTDTIRKSEWGRKDLTDESIRMGLTMVRDLNSFRTPNALLPILEAHQAAAIDLTHTDRMLPTFSRMYGIDFSSIETMRFH